MYWQFTPMSHHYDFGFGAVADSFEQAAKRIETSSEEGSFINWQIVSCFLRRHAIELYLKSLIVLLERRFSNKKEISLIRIVDDNNKERTITTTHSIGVLFRHLEGLMSECEAEIKTACETDWSSLASELSEPLKFIHDRDKRGDYFRYPSPQNVEDANRKSAFKKFDHKMIETHQGKKPAKFFIAKFGKRETEAYMLDHKNLADDLQALNQALVLLSAAHFGLNTELVGGY